MSTAIDLRIRDAAAADAAELARVMREWFIAAYAHASDAANTGAFVAHNFETARQQREIADPQIRTFIAEIGTGWAGYAQLRYATQAPPSVAADGAAEVGRFYFAPAQHGAGLAGRLMDTVKQAARERGRRRLWLYCWQESPQALRFYEKHGFEKVGTAIFMVGADRKHDFVMCAELE